MLCVSGEDGLRWNLQTMSLQQSLLFLSKRHASFGAAFAGKYDKLPRSDLARVAWEAQFVWRSCFA